MSMGVGGVVFEERAVTLGRCWINSARWGSVHHRGGSHRRQSAPQSSHQRALLGERVVGLCVVAKALKEDS